MNYIDGQSKKLNKALRNSVITAGILGLTCLTAVGLTDYNKSKLAEAKETKLYVCNLPEKQVDITNVKLTAGIATVLEDVSERDKAIYLKEKQLKEKEEQLSKEARKQNMVKIRCTGYADHGVTKSGEITRHGVVAGKKEWLGNTCTLYTVDENGNPGEFIGTYEFLDTGYGINGSIINGTSIDVWHSTEEAVWEWVRTYGDYVYMEMSNANTIS